MMNSKRQCQIKDHESNNSKYICTFNDCKVGNRWICSECLVELLHHHGKQKQDHIMKQQQFLQLVLRQQELSKNDQYCQSLKELLKESEQLIQSAFILNNQINNQINKYTQQQDLRNILNLVKNDFYKIENSQIKQIIYMKNKNEDLEQSNELLNSIRQQNQAINNIIKVNEQRMEAVKDNEIENQQAVIPQQMQELQEQQNKQIVQQDQEVQRVLGNPLESSDEDETQTPKVQVVLTKSVSFPLEQ